MASSSGSQKPWPSCWEWPMAWPVMLPSKRSHVSESSSCSPTTNPRAGDVAVEEEPRVGVLQLLTHHEPEGRQHGAAAAARVPRRPGRIAPAAGAAARAAAPPAARLLAIFCAIALGGCGLVRSVLPGSLALFFSLLFASMSAMYSRSTSPFSLDDMMS